MAANSSILNLLRGCTSIYRVLCIIYYLDQPMPSILTVISIS